MVREIKLRDETTMTVETIVSKEDPDLRVCIEFEYGGGFLMKLKLTANERAELMQALQASIDE